jgi:hypothetical protein
VEEDLHKLLSTGGIAQLGERLHGMQEVSGSIPLTSTITPGQHTANESNEEVFAVPIV